MTNILTELLLRLAITVSSDDRKERLQEWQDECRDVDQPVLHAMGFVRTAVSNHPPFDVAAHLLPGPSPDDLKELRRIRVALKLFGMILLLLGLLMALDGLSQNDLVWLLRSATPLGVALAGSFTGFGQDIPWLRATRLGSALLLAFVFIAPVLIALLHAWTLLGATWFTFAVLLMVWDHYWAVQRPLRRRGLLGR